jgi:hypothetical protein
MVRASRDIPSTQIQRQPLLTLLQPSFLPSSSLTPPFLSNSSQFLTLLEAHQIQYDFFESFRSPIAKWQNPSSLESVTLFTSSTSASQFLLVSVRSSSLTPSRDRRSKPGNVLYSTLLKEQD